MGKSYWMFVSSAEEFDTTQSLGFTLYGVGSKYRRRAERMQPDDRVLFYLSKLRKWAVSATLTSGCFEDRTPIWENDGSPSDRPYRVKLKPDIILDESDYIDALILAPRLEYVKRWAPEDWPLAFFDALHLLPQRDYRLIEGEMKRISSARHRSHRRRWPNLRDNSIPSDAAAQVDGITPDSDDQSATDDSSAGSR